MASISEITQEAEVAMGTFYLYFKDKEDIFRALVQHMLELVRAHLRKHVGQAQTQIESRAARAQGVPFLRVAPQEPVPHRARFLLGRRDHLQQLLQVFADVYSRRLGKAERAGRDSPGDAEVRAWCLDRHQQLLGMRYALWKRPASMDKVVDTAFDMISTGWPHDERAGTGRA
ncbi:TetR/AcrR family transcriptional regulator [Cupriavidus basilensis]